MNGLVFELTDVVFRYRYVTALNALSVQIRTGSRVALLGANGSGKSTLLRVLAGLYFAEAGTVSFRGQTLTEDDFLHDEFSHAFRRNVGLVFQDPDVQLFCPSVLDEVAFGPLQLGLSRNDVLEAVDRALGVFEIAHLRHRSPHHLSGGEKKRVALACVLVMEPAVLLLDEPTAALDPGSQTRMIELLRTWHSPARTMVIATHDLNLARDLSDDCVVLDKGRVLAHGPSAEVLEDSGLLHRANLIDITRSRTTNESR